MPPAAGRGTEPPARTPRASEASAISALEPLQHRLGVPGEEVPQALNVSPVRLFGDAGLRGHTWARATADVVVEAGSPGSRPLVEEVVGAGSDGEHPRQGIEGVPDRPGVPVRTEVPHLLPFGAPEDLRARPLLPHRQREVGIGLVVAVPDVETRPVLLDQVELEHQRVDLAGGDDPLDARRPRRPWPAVRGWRGRDQ